jgi:hypothetical protein
MKNFRDYLSESEEAATNPVAGDTFAINIREECLIESVVVESREDGVVIAADDRMMQLLESYGYTFEENCMECGMPECGCGDPAAYSDDESQDPGEYDDEGDMAKDELMTMIRSARRLIGMLDNADNMPEWTQKKITKATDYVDTAADYIASKKERGVMEQDVAEGYPSDNDMGTVAGTNNKMTLGQWKQMWQKKMPNADMSLFRFPPNMKGSAIAYFDGWVNTPGARWDPEKGVT